MCVAFRGISSRLQRVTSPRSHS